MLKLQKHLRLRIPSSVRTCTQKFFDEIYSRPEHESQKPQDLLSIKIGRMSEIPKLLEIVDRHHDVMDASHYLKCWKTLETIKTMNSVPMNSLQEQNFQTLVENTQRYIRSTTLNQAVDLLPALVELKIPSDSQLFQSNLNIIKKGLTNLSLRQQMFIHRNLRSIKNQDPLSQALIVSIPLVLQFQVRTKLDLKSPELCYRTFIFASRNCSDPETMKFLVQSLSRHKESFSLNETIKILDAFSAGKKFPVEVLDEDATISKFFTDCVNDVVEKSGKLSDVQMENLRKMNFLKRTRSYPLLGVMWDSVDERISKETFERMLFSVHANEYDSLKCLRTIRDLMLSRRDEILTFSVKSKIALSWCVATLQLQAGENNEILDEVKEIFGQLSNSMDNSELLGERRWLIKYIRNLGAMGIFQKELLDLLFGDQASLLLAINSESTAFELLEIQQCLDFHQIKGYELNSKVKKHASRAVSNRREFKQDVVETLKSAFGGKEFVAFDLTTPAGTAAEAVVVMRNGLYPMAIMEKKNVFEEVPEGSKVVALLTASENDRLRETDEPNRYNLHLSLQLQHLRMQTICPLVINLTSWEKLHERDRIPTLMQQLRQALQGIDDFKELNHEIRAENICQ